MPAKAIDSHHIHHHGCYVPYATYARIVCHVDP